MNYRYRMLQIVALAIVAMTTLGIAPQGKAQLPKSLRLYVFNCGSLNIPDTSPYQLKKEELATTYMSVPCFLVAHPRGTMIWDAGAVPDTAFKSGGGPGWGTAKNIIAGARLYDVWEVNEDAEYHEAGSSGIKEALTSERQVPRRVAAA